MIRRRNYLILVLTMTATLADESSAAAFDDTDLLQLSLQELAQVPITGPTRSKQSIISVPAAVTVFTHDEIERLGIDFLYELLAYVPGYQSFRNSDDALSFTYDSRGRRNSSQSREVVLLIDGRPFNDPRTGGTNTNIRQLPLQQFERIEVIRGPGSAVYGSNAFTGVINMVSRKNVNEARVAAGSFDIIPALVGSTRTYINGDDENSQGIELELRHQIATNWLLGATWTLLDHLPRSAYKEADRFGSVTLNYRHGAWNWNIGTIYQSNRDMLTPPSPGVRMTLDDYWLVQTRLGYTPTRHWQFYLQAKNALDENYLTPTEGNTLPQGVPARGRELLLGTRYLF